MSKAPTQEGEIRPATLDDLSDINNIYSLLGRKTPISSDELTKFLENPNQHLDVYIEPDGKFAAVVSWCVWPASLSYPKPICFIQDIAALPQYNGRGITTILLLHVRQSGLDMGIELFHVQCDPDNAAAQQLYTKNSFKARTTGLYCLARGPIKFG